MKLPLQTIQRAAPTPTTQAVAEDWQYLKLLNQFEMGMSGIRFTPEYVNSILEVLEACFSYVPSSTSTQEVPDVSLFDHVKITAALAACIVLYCIEQNITDYKTALMTDEKEFDCSKAFALASVDISGIQSFIYRVSTSSALKNLRARSFYLEILLENLVDEILDACSLTRANLLYTGGGHAYFILPNTVQAKKAFEQTTAVMNRSLQTSFGIDLYVASGYEPCSANALMSLEDDPLAYTKLFQSLSQQISKQKLHRYNADEVLGLNAASEHTTGRECSICGTLFTGENDVCPLCQCFIRISKPLLTEQAVFIVTTSCEDGLPLWNRFGQAQSMIVCTQQQALELLQNKSNQVVRLYSKNLYRTGLSMSSKLWMGDYASRNTDGSIRTFEEMSDEASGISRLAVLRMDVDNFGSAFTHGFVRDHSESPYRYLTLSRTASFSRSMSVFFKFHINDILENGRYHFQSSQRSGNCCIVYTGGDDVFIVGAWDDVFCAAIDIHEAFDTFCGGVLTISAGLAVFQDGYPLVAMARETGELEQLSKSYHHDNQCKDAISLFGQEIDHQQVCCKHTYSWRELCKEVIDEKLHLVDKLLTSRTDLGHSFLYRLVELLRNGENDRLNIARLAYFLARREDRKASTEAVEIYKQFTQKVYAWALSPRDRKQLLTALMILIYTRRGEKEEERL